MSPSPTLSISTSSKRRSQSCYVCIGPNPNAPDGIILARFRKRSSYGNETHTGRYRSQLKASHPLNDHCDTTKILGTLQDRLKPTIANLNKNRPLTGTGDSQQFNNDRATWESAVKSRIQQLSKDSTDPKLTLVLCLCPSAYAEALSNYSVGPFSKQEHDLLRKYGLSKNATRAEQIEVHDPSTQETDKSSPSRIINPYIPGHNYHSDSEIPTTIFDDDSDHGSQRAGQESGKGYCSREEASRE
jgi:hypothetical protein